MNDNEIIDLYFSRSESAITQTKLKYSSYLNTISMNILSNTEDADECENDTYFKTWNAIPPHNPPSLKFFLGKIIRELSIDRLRKRYSAKRNGSEYDLSLEELEEVVPNTENPVQTAETTLLSECINTYLNSCKRESRDMFVMRYYFCDSVKKIAECCGVSEGKVKSVLFRMREGLKNYLEKEGFSV